MTKSVLVLYDYEPKTDREIELTAGERVTVLDRSNKEWWEGEEKDGNVGFFPCAYVLDEAEADSAVVGRTCICEFDYKSSTDSDMSMKVGDVFTVLDTTDDEWWSVKSASGQVAFVPAKFVKLQEDGKAGKSAKSSKSSSKSSKSSKKSKSKAGKEASAPVMEKASSGGRRGGGKKKERPKVRVTYSYEADGDNELTVTEGEVLELIAKASADWWEGRNRKGVSGFFPAAYCEEIGAESQAHRSKGRSDKKSEKKPKGDSKSDGKHGRGKSSKKQHDHKKSEKAEEEEEEEEDKEPARKEEAATEAEEEEEDDDDDDESGSGSASTERFKARVMFDYEANSDATTEMSIKTGWVVEVTDTSNGEWWEGVYDGRIGFFPAAFVERIVEQEQAPPARAPDKPKLGSDEYTPPPKEEKPKSMVGVRSEYSTPPLSELSAAKLEMEKQMAAAAPQRTASTDGGNDDETWLTDDDEEDDDSGGATKQLAASVAAEALKKKQMQEKEEQAAKRKKADEEKAAAAVAAAEAKRKAEAAEAEAKKQQEREAAAAAAAAKAKAAEQAAGRQRVALEQKPALPSAPSESELKAEAARAKLRAATELNVPASKAAPADRLYARLPVYVNQPQQTQKRSAPAPGTAVGASTSAQAAPVPPRRPLPKPVGPPPATGCFAAETLRLESELKSVVRQHLGSANAAIVARHQAALSRQAELEDECRFLRERLRGLNVSLGDLHAPPKLPAKSPSGRSGGSFSVRPLMPAVRQLESQAARFASMTDSERKDVLDRHSMLKSQAKARVEANQKVLVELERLNQLLK